jgi:hypothetical protein
VSTGAVPGTTGAPRVSVAGEATDEDVAAIMAAVELVWPRGVAAGEPEEPPRWRFSGRWWSRPIPTRRDRPW